MSSIERQGASPMTGARRDPSGGRGAALRSVVLIGVVCNLVDTALGGSGAITGPCLRVPGASALVVDAVAGGRGA